MYTILCDVDPDNDTRSWGEYETKADASDAKKEIDWACAGTHTIVVRVDEEPERYAE